RAFGGDQLDKPVDSLMAPDKLDIDIKMEEWKEWSEEVQRKDKERALEELAARTRAHVDQPPAKLPRVLLETDEEREAALAEFEREQIELFGRDPRLDKSVSESESTDEDNSEDDDYEPSAKKRRKRKSGTTRTRRTTDATKGEGAEFRCEKCDVSFSKMRYYKQHTASKKHNE
ncbi:hypothetical protein PMAYCL1PPCAC_09418, partial [Pristionchus mayeri]